MQRQFFNSNRGRHGHNTGRFGAVLAMASVLLLSACDSNNNTVTENSLSEPGKDGVPPVLTTVTIQPDGVVSPGQAVRIDFTASEALMTPVVYINNVRAEVNGKIASWNAVREITDTDPVGDVTFSIVYQDVSGELGQAVIATTDGSVACIGDDCVTDELGPLEGHWKLDFAGVGPAEGDTSWFSIADTGPDGPRACWFDDTYEFGADGSFRNNQGAETYLETWQGVAEGCGTPVAPHDGSNNAVFDYDEAAGTLQLSGLGAYLGLAKVVNGAELLTPADAPESVTYKVVQLIGDSLTVRIDVGNGDAWWEFRLSRISTSPLVGNWKLNFAGVGPAEGDTSWFSIADTGPDGPRACWFDDIYHFGGDTSFQNFLGGETYLETWQGVTEGCGTPVAPHDGSTAGSWYYDEAGGDLRVTGLGSFLGLAKVVNGAELTTPADAPAFVTYKVVELIGDSLTVRIDVGNGDAWWEFRFERVPPASELRGNWQLEFAGVGPTEGDTSWFSIADTGPDGPRACWFDDVYEFGRDGSFGNDQGGETYLETWQGVAEGCGAPVAPHDGSNNAVFEYDAEAGTLQLTGLGAYLGLAKVVNGAELATPADTPDSVTYKVTQLIGDSLTIRVDVGTGWWEFRLARISTSDLVGNWKLNFAGVGPAEGDTSWFSIADTGPDGPRACWFDDIYHIGADTSFQNFMGGETYLETWQGVTEGCGTPVAPHDGSTAGSWYYDEAAGDLTLSGVGSFMGLAKVVNGAELTTPADAPASVTYKVVELIGGSLTIRIDVGNGDAWWEFDFVKNE